MPTIDLGQVVGPAGQDGADGAPGAAAAITGVSASASTLLPTAPATASVTAGGTDAARTFAFAFGIPKGDTGDAGPNSISGTTATTLTGILKGNGSTVETATVDSTPNASHTGNLISSAGVAGALAGKASTENLVAHIEATASSLSRAYEVDEYFVYNGTLYRCTSAISAGDAMAVGTNCAAATIGNDMYTMRRKYVLSGNGKAVSITLGSASSIAAYLAAVIGPRANNTGLYYLDLCTSDSQYHFIHNIVAASNVSVASSGGVCTITNNTSNTVTVVLFELHTKGSVAITST